MSKNKGFTLIEVILSIALIGIIAIPVLMIFDTGLKNIVRSGHRSVQVFSTINKIDQKILNPHITDINNDRIDDYDDTITLEENLEINIEGLLSDDIQIQSKKITIRSIDDMENKIIIETFITD